MCATCGSGTHEPEGAASRTVVSESDLLAKNERIATDNRKRFATRGIAAFNFTSAPGAGKTSLLEVVVRELGGRVPLAVIEGDQETERDAERIRGAGAPVVQVNTGTGCHLDAEMVERALARLEAPRASLLLIENVGNLVCPALFDLGEHAMVVVMSVTEGEDKPLKYPHMFRAAKVLVVTKTDLLPHLDFSLDACLANARQVNPKLRIFRLSVRDGEGVAEFCAWMAWQAAVPIRQPRGA